MSNCFVLYTNRITFVSSEKKGELTKSDGEDTPKFFKHHLTVNAIKEETLEADVNKNMFQSKNQFQSKNDTTQASSSIKTEKEQCSLWEMASKVKNNEHLEDGFKNFLNSLLMESEIGQGKIKVGCGIQTQNQTHSSKKLLKEQDPVEILMGIHERQKKKAQGLGKDGVADDIQFKNRKFDTVENEICLTIAKDNYNESIQKYIESKYKTQADKKKQFDETQKIFYKTFKELTSESLAGVITSKKKEFLSQFPGLNFMCNKEHNNDYEENSE